MIEWLVKPLIEFALKLAYKMIESKGDTNEVLDRLAKNKVDDFNYSYKELIMQLNRYIEMNEITQINDKICQSNKTPEEKEEEKKLVRRKVYANKSVYDLMLHVENLVKDRRDKKVEAFHCEIVNYVKPILKLWVDEEDSRKAVFGAADNSLYIEEVVQKAYRDAVAPLKEAGVYPDFVFSSMSGDPEIVDRYNVQASHIKDETVRLSREYYMNMMFNCTTKIPYTTRYAKFEFFGFGGVASTNSPINIIASSTITKRKDCVRKKLEFNLGIKTLEIEVNEKIIGRDIIFDLRKVTCVQSGVFNAMNILVEGLKIYSPDPFKISIIIGKNQKNVIDAAHSHKILGNSDDCKIYVQGTKEAEEYIRSVV